MPKHTMSLKMRTLKSKIIDELNTTKAKGSCILYSQLAANLGGYAPDSKYIAICLGSLQEYDTKNNLPLRSALVVRKDTGRPGHGFYECAKDLGHKFRDEEKFWREQIRGLIGGSITMPI